jgi:hypothetical protein
MNRYIIFGGILSSIVVLIVLLLPEEDLSVISIESTTIDSIEPSSDVDISFEQTEQKEIIKVQKIQKKSTPKKIIVKKPTKVKYTTFDRSHKYRLSLIDETKTALTNPKKRVIFGGKIDGKHFAIWVPQELLKSDLKLNITDLKTGEKKEVSIPFIADIIPGTMSPEIDMDFTSPNNYSVNFPTQDGADFPGRSIYE